MNIQEIRDFCKSLLTDSERFTALLLALVATASFGLGRLSVERTAAEAATSGEVSQRAAVASGAAAPEATAAPPTTVNSEDATVPEGGYVASVSGARYHLPWCSGAGRIKEENKLWFATKAEAEAAGYTPAKNCKGI